MGGFEGFSASKVCPHLSLIAERGLRALQGFRVYRVSQDS